MSAIQTIAYANRTATRLLIILEPWAEQYWLAPGDQIEIKAHRRSAGHLELEVTKAALIVYGWAGSTVRILRDGVELIPSAQA
jgi:hypothetical protein